MYVQKMNTYIKTLTSKYKLIMQNTTKYHK